jgi:hypothetical protein
MKQSSIQNPLTLMNFTELWMIKILLNGKMVFFPTYSRRCAKRRLKDRNGRITSDGWF